MPGKTDLDVEDWELVEQSCDALWHITSNKYEPGRRVQTYCGKNWTIPLNTRQRPWCALDNCPDCFHP